MLTRKLLCDQCLAKVEPMIPNGYHSQLTDPAGLLFQFLCNRCNAKLKSIGAK